MSRGIGWAALALGALGACVQQAESLKVEQAALCADNHQSPGKCCQRRYRTGAERSRCVVQAAHGKGPCAQRDASADHDATAPADAAAMDAGATTDATPPPADATSPPTEDAALPAADAAAAPDAASISDSRDAVDAADTGAPIGSTCGPSPFDQWSAMSVTAPLRSLWAIAPNQFLGVDNQLRFWNGSIWITVTPQPPFIGEVRATSVHDIWIQEPISETGPNRIAHFDGTTWADVSVPGVLHTALRWVAGPDNAWATASEPLIPGTTIPSQMFSVQHWDGHAWVWQLFLGGGFTFGPGWASSPNDVWIAVPEFGLEHWDGVAWNLIDVPLARGVTPPRLASVWGTSARDVWAVGSDGSGLLATWHYDGTRWMYHDTPLMFGQLTALWGACPSSYWAVGPDVTTTQPALWSFDGQQWSTARAVVGASAITGTGSDDVWVTQTGVASVQRYQPNLCGNGIVDPGESCEIPSGILCRSCALTTCGNCFNQIAGGGAACGNTSGQDRSNCLALVNCAASNVGACTANGLSLIPCYSTRAPGDPAPPNGPCADLMAAVAHTTDLVEMSAQINDPSTVLGTLNVIMDRFAVSSCGFTCTRGF